MAEKRDYYEVLGISKTATKQEIKKAYRQLAKQYHPDRNKEAGAEEKFKEVQEAYDILADDQKRAAYDQYGFAGTQGFSGGSDFGGMGDFTNFGEAFGGGDFGGLGDLLEGFFGGGLGGFGASQQRRGPSTGTDLQINLNLSFTEAVFGVEKDINYDRYMVCNVCDGSGAKNGKKKTCPDCNGKGQVTKMQRTILGTMQVVTTCPTCHGAGEVIEEKCLNCNGQGVIKQRDTLKIKIPAGIPDGVNLRFNSKGNAGALGGGYGDLYVNIEVTPHIDLERRGNDIYSDKHIDVETAVLGGEVTIPSVHGALRMKVPAGTQSEKILKLKNQGGPRFQGNGNGDQYVRLIVDIPTKLSKDEKKLWEDLKRQRE